MKAIKGHRSLRELWRLTGVSHSRISDMLFGIVPSYGLLLRFTQSLDLTTGQVRDLFVAAGYAPPLAPDSGDDTSERDAAYGVLADGLAELEAEFPEAGGLSWEGRDEDSLTPDQARRWIAAIRALLLEKRERGMGEG